MPTCVADDSRGIFCVQVKLDVTPESPSQPSLDFLTPAGIAVLTIACRTVSGTYAQPASRGAHTWTRPIAACVFMFGEAQQRQRSNHLYQGAMRKMVFGKKVEY